MGAGPNQQPQKSYVPKGQRKRPVDSAPVSQQRVQVMTAPSMTTSAFAKSDARVRVRHREYLQDISGSIAFANVQVPINPGLPGSFPWLAQLAANYESYQFRSLMFEYETLSSTATAGKVMMAVDYDASDSAPGNKTELMAFHDSVSSATWQECCFKADPQDLKKFGSQRFVRAGNAPSNTDIKTYDIGTLNIATQGMSGTSAVGELYVSYDVELMTPQLNQVPVSSGITGGGTVSKTAPLGTAPTLRGNAPVVFSNTSSKLQLTFSAPGQWLFDCTAVGTGLVRPTLTGTSTSVIDDELILVAATSMLSNYLINVTGSGQTFILDYSGSTTVTATDYKLSQYATANG